jgi:hypothetical protein
MTSSTVPRNDEERVLSGPNRLGRLELDLVGAVERDDRLANVRGWTSLVGLA